MCSKKNPSLLKTNAKNRLNIILLLVINFLLCSSRNTAEAKVFQLTDKNSALEQVFRVKRDGTNMYEFPINITTNNLHNELYRHDDERWKHAIEVLLNKKRKEITKEILENTGILYKEYVEKLKRLGGEELANSYPDFVWNKSISGCNLENDARINETFNKAHFPKYEPGDLHSKMVVDTLSSTANLRNGVEHLMDEAFHTTMKSAAFEEIVNEGNKIVSFPYLLVQKHKMKLGCCARLQKNIGEKPHEATFSIFCEAELVQDAPAPPAPKAVVPDVLPVFMDLRAGIWNKIAGKHHYAHPLAMPQLPDGKKCFAGSCSITKYSDFIREIYVKMDKSSTAVKNDYILTVINSFIVEPNTFLAEREAQMQKITDEKKAKLEVDKFDRYGFEYGINDQFYESAVYTFNEEIKKSEAPEPKCAMGSHCMALSHSSTHKKADFYVKYDTELGHQISIDATVAPFDDVPGLIHEYDLKQRIALLKILDEKMKENATNHYKSLNITHKTDPVQLKIGCYAEFRPRTELYIQHYFFKCKTALYDVTKAGPLGWIYDPWNRSFYLGLNGEQMKIIFEKFNAMQVNIKLHANPGNCADCIKNAKADVTLEYSHELSTLIDNAFCLGSVIVIELQDDAAFKADNPYSSEINFMEGLKSYVRGRSGAVPMGCRADLHHDPHEVTPHKKYKAVLCCKVA